MTSSGALAGRHIVVTRPREQAAPLAAAIRAEGGEVLLFPLLEIVPLAESPLLAVAARQLADYALAVFVSPNAVAHALPTLLAGQPWPEHLRPAAVGPGTARALADAGIPACLLPQQRFDSEGLLALPELAAERLAGQRVAIFRGDGGRELLADTLRTRGVTVDCIPCYQRRAPVDSYQPLLAAWQAGQLDALVISSSEALRYLLAGLPAAAQEWLATTPVFVPHARIAEQAAALGLRRVVLTAATDSGLLAGLVAYNWRA